MSFTDAQKENKIELALSISTRLAQEFGGSGRTPGSVVLWPAFESPEQARREVQRIAFYVGEHEPSLRYSVEDAISFDCPGVRVPETDLIGLTRLPESLVLVWKYESLRALPLRALRRIRIVDPNFHDKCEALTAARLVRWDLASPDKNARLEELSRRRLRNYHVDMSGPAAVFGTGPGLDLFSPDEISNFGTRVGCNSMVVSEDVLRRTKPNVICFGDPVFHFGHSEQAAEFRDALQTYVERENPWVFLPFEFGGWVDDLILENDRVIPLGKTRRGRFNIPNDHSPIRRVTGNVLTELMLPVAAAVSSDLHIFGCDGRPPSSDRFWDYGKGVHDEDRYSTAVDAHPSFFRDRRYVRYYEEHCETLESLLVQLESNDVQITNRSPSQVPALKRRSKLDLSSPARTSSTIDLSATEESEETAQ